VSVPMGQYFRLFFYIVNFVIIVNIYEQIWSLKVGHPKRGSNIVYKSAPQYERRSAKSRNQKSDKIFKAF